MIAIPPFIIGGIAFCNNNSEKEYTNVSFLRKTVITREHRYRRYQIADIINYHNTSELYYSCLLFVSLFINEEFTP